MLDNVRVAGSFSLTVTLWVIAGSLSTQILCHLFSSGLVSPLPSDDFPLPFSAPLHLNDASYGASDAFRSFVDRFPDNRKEITQFEHETQLN